jgi:hypothetical protein
VEPLSAERYRVEFTASAMLRAKLEQAQELTSHALPNGDHFITGLPVLSEAGTNSRYGDYVHFRAVRFLDLASR